LVVSSSHDPGEIVHIWDALDHRGVVLLISDVHDRNHNIDDKEDGPEGVANKKHGRYLVGWVNLQEDIWMIS
jgi:hypothetical protein